MDFFKLLPLILKDTNLSNYDKLVYLALISFNGAKKCFPSRSAIAERINSPSLKHISASLTNLKKHNYIGIKRRKRNTNLYMLNTEKIKPKTIKPIPMEKGSQKARKITRQAIAPVLEPDNAKFIAECCKSTIAATAEIIAKAGGREKAEGGDYAFVNTMVKLKAGDKYKNDGFDTVRKCLILMSLVKACNNKFEEQSLSSLYSYFNVAYSRQIYQNVHSGIFSKSNMITLKYPDEYE